MSIDLSSTATVAAVPGDGSAPTPAAAPAPASAGHGTPGTASVNGAAEERTLQTIRAIDDFYRRVDELYRQTAARMGLAECDFDILYALTCEDGLTQKQLCERGFSSKQTVHSAVKRMTAKGFVTMCGESPRSMRAYLTEKGRERCERDIRSVLAGERAAVETFSPDEQAALVSAMNRYADALDANLAALAFPS